MGFWKKVSDAFSFVHTTDVIVSLGISLDDGELYIYCKLKADDIDGEEQRMRLTTRERGELRRMLDIADAAHAKGR